MQDYERERIKFKEQHPDKVKEDENEEDIAKYYEDATQRELRLIYEGQNAIHQVMQQMEQKLRDISQQQNVHTSMLQQGGAQVGGQAVGAAGGGFLQHEKNEALQSLRDLTSSIRDMKNYVNEIFTRTYNMEQRLSSGGSTGGQPVAQQDPALKQHLENIQNDIRQIRTTQLGQAAGPSSCPNITCLSSTYFLVIICVQSGVILAVLLLRNKTEKAHFY